MVFDIRKHVYMSGLSNRNPSALRILDELNETEWYSSSDLREYQLRKTKSFLMHARKTSPYYKKLFQRVGFDPSQMSSIAELQVIPTVCKTDLINNNKEIHSKAEMEKCFLAETSGTSGVSLSFLRNEEWDSANRAHVMRAYSWYGVNVWDRNGYFWGLNLSRKERFKTAFLDYFQNRVRLFKYDNQSILSFVDVLRNAKYLAGYSSMIYEVAKVVNTNEIEFPKVNLVKGTSEMILDAYQPEVKAAFGTQMRSEYGAAEAGLISFECPYGGKHINIESVVLEIGDNNELLVTNLESRSFPIIRYKLGDEVILSDKKCPCGRAHPLIEEVKGRKGKNVIGFSGTYPALTFYYVFKNIALKHGVLLNYKVSQHVIGEVAISIEGPVKNSYSKLISAEMKIYFGSDLDYSINSVGRFDLGEKKRQYFESTLE